MTGTSRILALRQFAALLRRGDSAGEALARVEAALPPGDLRDQVSSAARTLATGAPQAPGEFARVLASPAARAEHADTLAEALEVELEARAAIRAGKTLLQFVLAAPPVTLAIVGWVDLRTLTGGAPLPGPTELVLGLGGAFRWLGVPVAALCVLAVEWLGSRFAPGARTLTRARHLLELSTLADLPARIGKLELNRAEHALLHGLGGPSLERGAILLASELRREAGATQASFRLFAPVVLALLALWFFGGIAAAMYLPIFSIAGAIK